MMDDVGFHPNNPIGVPVLDPMTCQDHRCCGHSGSRPASAAAAPDACTRRRWLQAVLAGGCGLGI
jgi:hypothetical protein